MVKIFAMNSSRNKEAPKISEEVEGIKHDQEVRFLFFGEVEHMEHGWPSD